MNKMNFDRVLQDCLERVLEEGEDLDLVVAEYPVWSTQLRSELESALWLRASKEKFDPRPGFVSSTRVSLVERLNRGWEEDSKVRYHLVGRFPRLALVFILILGVFLAGGGLALAADGALPGEGLYPVKIAIEDLRLAATFDDEKDFVLHLQFAQEHLVACALLASQGDVEGAQIALRNYERHMTGTGRVLRTLNLENASNAQNLLADFNQIFLQDLEILNILLPDEFRMDQL